MKTILPILGLLVLVSCEMKAEKASELVQETEQEIEKHEFILPEFQTILDSAKVNGSILILDFTEGKYYSNDFVWARKGNLPASTFKIPNSIIALETGVVEDDSTISKWNGEEHMLDLWEQDLVLRDAFHYSCVPCYREIARKIGFERMNEYLDKLQFGNMVVDSSTLDLFWLRGESTISQFEEIDFLSRFYNSKLPITTRTQNIMKRMMVIEENTDYKLSGKTGWSTGENYSNGWFVGYIESNGKTLFFATNIEPQEDLSHEDFPAIRKEVTLKALEYFGISVKS